MGGEEAEERGEDRKGGTGGEGVGGCGVAAGAAWEGGWEWEWVGWGEEGEGGGGGGLGRETSKWMGGVISGRGDF